ncbi:hypothetical protein Tco_1086768 [Tanacetum coccineum]
MSPGNVTWDLSGTKSSTTTTCHPPPPPAPPPPNPPPPPPLTTEPTTTHHRHSHEHTSTIPPPPPPPLNHNSFLNPLNDNSSTFSNPLIFLILITSSCVSLTCSSTCKGLKKNVKLTNLVRLRDLEISSLEEDDLWDITNVPTLASFYYCSLFGSWTKPIPFQMESLATASVTQLRLDGLALDNSFFDIVKAKFPLLQSLTLGIGHWGLPQLVITNDSLKWLTRDVYEPGPLNVQVYAPALLSFTYIGLHMIPGLSFPSIAPEHINLTFTRREPMEHSFFLKMREALNLSSKFDINIIHYNDNEQQEDLLVPVGIL